MENSIPTIYIKRITGIRFSQDADYHIPKRVYDEMRDVWFNQVSKDPEYFDGAAGYTEKEADEKLIQLFEEQLSRSLYRDYVKHLRFSSNGYIIKNGVLSRY